MDRAIQGDEQAATAAELQVISSATAVDSLQLPAPAQLQAKIRLKLVVFVFFINQINRTNRKNFTVQDCGLKFISSLPAS